MRLRFVAPGRNVVRRAMIRVSLRLETLCSHRVCSFYPKMYTRTRPRDDNILHTRRLNVTVVCNPFRNTTKSL